MQIIPVIDLSQGLVVHAREGQREHYRPLVSLLCASPEPSEVLRGILAFYPFQTVYLADLDALSGRPPQDEQIRLLGRQGAGIRFWIDQGVPSLRAGVFTDRYFSPVIGSESLQYDNLSILADADDQVILSLDFRQGVLLGPTVLLDQPAEWPKRVIVMSLSHVGSQRGPDFSRLADLMARHPDHDFIAAGGVRHADDLWQLQAMEVSAVLMASALHDGRVNRAIIERLTG